MEILIGTVSILLTIIGVYYAREQVIVQRRERLSAPKVTFAKNVLEKIKTEKLLRVGCLWYPPFVEYRIEQKIVIASGLYPDILKTLGESQDINVQFFILKWHEAIDALSTGKVDVVACVLKSADRRANCDFAGTVFRVGVGAVVRSGQKKIHTHGDLVKDDISIAVTKGEIGWTYAKENLGLLKNSGKFTILKDKSIQTMMSLVEKGIVDCALADSLSCAQFIGSAIENQQLLSDIFAATPIHVEDNALMVAKDNPDFVDWLESGINEIRMQPEINILEHQIATQYPNILHRASTFM